MDKLEETVLLRLPPRLATRLTARLKRQERLRGEGSLRRRKKKNQSGDQSENDLASTKAELSTLMLSVWGDEGAPDDYNSSEEATDDLFNLVQDYNEAEDDNTTNNEMEDEEEEDFPAAATAETDLCKMEYWRVEGRDYIFSLGPEESYYASLVNLPCVTEVQKLTVDNSQVFKTGNVGQCLIVHDVLTTVQPRPSECKLGKDFAHGINPPMYDIASRYKRVSPEARRGFGADNETLTIEEVREADSRMSETKDLVMERHKKLDNHAEKGTQRKNAKQKDPSHGMHSGPTVFIHEEIIDSEPWMENHPDDVIVVERGDDEFVSSTKNEAYRARENFRKMRLAAEGGGFGNSTGGGIPLSFPPTAFFGGPPPIMPAATSQDQFLGSPQQSPPPFDRQAKIAELKRQIDTIRQELLGVNNPQLRMNKEAHMYKLATEVQQLEAEGVVGKEEEDDDEEEDTGF